MTQPLDSLGRTVAAVPEPRATPPYGLLSVISGQSAQAVREHPEVLESANRQLRSFIDAHFGAGATPREDEVRVRLAAEIGRYVPAMAGTPNLGTLRAALVERLGVHPEANLLEMLGAAERRWPARVQQAPSRGFLGFGAPRPPMDLVAPQVDPAVIEAQRRRAEALARRQQNLVDIVDLWRSLPGDRDIHQVQKDEYRAHALSELERMYGSREAGLQAVATIDASLAAEMGRWVRPPPPTVTPRR